MSINRLLPVVIPQTYSFSLVSPYGSLKKMEEYHRRKEVIEVLHGIAHEVVYQSSRCRLSK